MGQRTGRDGAALDGAALGGDLGRAREKLDAELAMLTDHAVSLGVSWPQIAACLRVTRQAARQHYQRRHRDDINGQDRPV